MDEQKHRQLTGHEISNVLKTIRYLHINGKLKGVNEVIIPGFHTDEDVSRAQVSCRNRCLHSIPAAAFSPHGTTGDALGWESPTEEAMDRFVDLAQQQGLQYVSRSL